MLQAANGGYAQIYINPSRPLNCIYHQTLQKHLEEFDVTSNQLRYNRPKPPLPLGPGLQADSVASDTRTEVPFFRTCLYIFQRSLHSPHINSFTMVFLRSASRLARPASSLTARAGPRLTSGAAFLRQPNQFRTLTATASQQGKVLLVLYDVSWIAFDSSEIAADNVIGWYPRSAGAPSPRHNRERAWSEEVDRGAGTRAHHHLQQGGRGL